MEEKSAVVTHGFHKDSREVPSIEIRTSHAERQDKMSRKIRNLTAFYWEQENE